MKKALLLIPGLAILHLATAQPIIRTGKDSYFRKCTSFSVSKPLKELAESQPQQSGQEEPAIEAPDGLSDRGPLIQANPNAQPMGEDPVRQTTEGTRGDNNNKGFNPNGAPLINFEGSKDSYLPCDPSGAAGPNHYVQAVNCSYRVYDKTGKALISLLKLSTLWPSASSSLSDPVVLYDKMADRWLLTMLDVTNKAILMAVSKTADPTGAFYQYTFTPMPGTLVDYPKFSIWWDGYYQVGNTSTEKVAIYERTKMLTGDPNAGMIVSTITGMKRTSAFFCPVSLDADGQLPPAGSPNYIISYEDDAWGSGYKDQLDIFKVTADWTAKTATVTADPSLPVQAFNGIITSGRSDIPQQGTTNMLDGLDGLLMYRAPYRIWPGFNSVVLSHVVKVSSGEAGIRWYELRQDGSTKAWSIYQQGTYAPADGVYRCMPSIAMDDYGTIALCFSASSSSMYPSLRYTGRLKGDSLGKMTFAETTAIAGTVAQTSSQRFGDYSHTSLDPDGVTFWHTGEYMNGSGPRSTRIYSFQLPSTATGVSENQKQVEISIYQTDNKLIVKAANLPSDANAVVDLFDLSGKMIRRAKVNPVSGLLETSIDVSSLPKATYLVRIGNSSFQKVIKVQVN